MSKLDYQPLLGEAVHAFLGNSLFLGRNLDQTQERVKIEPRHYSLW